MKRFPLVGEANNAGSFENRVFENALGKAIILDTDATTSNGIVPDGELGFNPTSLKLFATLNGSTYLVATLTLV